ncbi:Cystathionine beta-lyase [hydrothermal vent metagenome]|uniref:Cystathionine beta-lyase n=1 Tax=hydrothermal vent metagenome TaxID=652676 RepID=A0A3B0TVM4_9ZZZZ
MSNNNNSNQANNIAGGAEQTLLTHLGRWPERHFGTVNAPVTRASTILFPDMETLNNHSQPYTYGRRGTPSSEAVEEIVTALEKGKGTRLTPSGLSALSCAIMSVVKAGDEILVSDSAYEPTRMFCDKILAPMGVTARYFDPRAGADIAETASDQTRAVLVESPGSLTFEIQDLPAISSALTGRDIAIIVDNTWATPLYYQPLKLGADISVHAGTKMFVGHSDAMFGTITANEKYWPQLLETHGFLGLCAAPDDCFLAARGLRTLAIRMKEHQSRALEIASWLESHDLVTRVLHPGLASHPDHKIFARDFSGSGSLFSFELVAGSQQAVAAMVDDLALFGLGYSWGGFESLILPVKLGANRTIVPWQSKNPLVRLHIGLEDIDDLKADLAAGLERYRAALG